jgi:hypothetical protein
MSQEAEKIKKLIAFKKKLEKKVEKLESELDELRLMVEVVHSILLEKGFKRAEIAKEPAAIEALPQGEEAIVQPSPEAEAEYENVIPLKTAEGELLANLYVSEDSLRVVPAEDKNFNTNTPPFTQFLVERVLSKMQEKDNKLARVGEITQDKIFSYNIVREGDMVQEIHIRNFDADRLRELKSSMRWTLEKMYEKMRS